jgi:hypothetical protein
LGNPHKPERQAKNFPLPGTGTSVRPRVMIALWGIADRYFSNRKIIGSLQDVINPVFVNAALFHRLN